MPDPVRIGIIGFGGHGQRRLVPAFANTRRARLVAIHKRDPGAVEAACQRFEVAHGFTDAAALAGHPEVDAVIVASPPALHAEHLTLAARAGKAVLMEKPLAMDAAEVAAMMAVVADSGVVAMPAFIMRYVRAVRELKDLIRKGRLGAIRTVAAVFTIDSSTSPRSWIDDPAISGGGPVADLGSHLLDLLEFLLDDDAGDVDAMVMPGPLPSSVERQAVINLRFSREVLGQVRVSFQSPFHNAVEVWGERGRARLTTFHRGGETVRLAVESDGGLDRIAITNGDHFADMIDRFAMAVAGEIPVDIPLAAGLRNQRLVDAVYAAARDPERQGG